ncbi:MAG: aminotransferase class I/II-fold pyridoxal phosphate-dependent enzyme [Alphaproteobacteria bacterium]|nr:aminotransferase class I/II-fold pyridoxal phosphate-dependent enzyme [Alphaproteobacteria bacterium]MDE2111755.1 aminotransferase class I/II-fold pyridoxal phosphate-dependent enzyme [Alphaproteobacteria bacterium]MDE2494920.1 aminotransferase class I/II-fold pyridoxal phosphate-dependent enzyme [Alphaproteobacteria bacterium]
MSPIRPSILGLTHNGIGRVSSLGLGQPDIIPLWFGETDLVTPSFIREAAKRALDDGATFYNHARGMMALREALRDFHKRTADVDVAVKRISVPGAATLAVVTALQCLIETGDNVVIVSPIWPSIFQAAQAVGAELRFARLDDDWQASPQRWRLDLDKLFALCDARTKAIFVCSPGNPTGWTATREEQQAILDFARRRGIAIISDEVYGTLVYNGSRHAPSFLQIAEPDDNLFVINSFSKPWAMTGWRIGWLVHPPSLDEPMDVICIANNTGPATFAQYGAMAALSPEGDKFRAEMLQRCRTGRDIVQKFLDGHNRIRWIKPDGAFYGFLHVDGLANSFGFARDLVLKHRVGVSPGSAFGPDNEVRDDSYLRICFAQDPERLGEGLSRIEKALSNP